MNIKVRPANPSDISFILDGSRMIEQRSYDIAPNPVTAERLHKEIFSDQPRAYITVAEVDGMRAGYLIYSFCYFASEGEGIWLTSFYIDPFNRKSGIGKFLTDDLKKRHPHVSGIYGSIANTNSIARHFFSSLGAKRYEDYRIYGFENDWSNA